MKLALQRNNGGVKWLRDELSRRELRSERIAAKRAAAELRARERRLNRLFYQSEILPVVIDLDILKQSNIEYMKV